jgi:hypothetical protein
MLAAIFARVGVRGELAQRGEDSIHLLVCGPRVYPLPRPPHCQCEVRRQRHGRPSVCRSPRHLPRPYRRNAAKATTQAATSSHTGQGGSFFGMGQS